LSRARAEPEPYEAGPKPGLLSRAALQMVSLCQPKITIATWRKIVILSLSLSLYPVMPLESFNVYREQLSSLRQGIALWEPNPIKGTYDQVSIGDVGYVSEAQRKVVRMG